MNKVYVVLLDGKVCLTEQNLVQLAVLSRVQDAPQYLAYFSGTMQNSYDVQDAPFF